ncbi:MAG: HD domain-containing phosphohydrolase [Streptosporangiales bacterium]
MAADGRSCSLAELLAALSLATDLGLGQPTEHVLRSCLIGQRLGQLVGLDDGENAAVYYVSLLAWVGCVADSYEVASVFGDDIAYRSDAHEVDLAGLPLAAFIVRRAGAGGSVFRRARLASSCLLEGRRGLERSIRAHCETTGYFAERLGLGAEVRDPLQQVYERWDGNGVPAGLPGDQLTMVARIVMMASILEVHNRSGGPEAALAVARRRRGTHFWPYLADAFATHGRDVLDGLDQATSWDAVIGSEPGLGRWLTDDELDPVLEALADYTDVKSPYTLGHSRGVATLAAAAGRGLGLPGPDITLLHRAGLIHDVGRQGIPNNILDKPGSLTHAEAERVRLHPYLVERIFARVGPLAPVGALAALHHERLDGSGYPRGLPATALPVTARLLAAADTYQAMTQPRPHRPAMPPDDAARELRHEARAGRLDTFAVEAVLHAAGQPVRSRPAHPAGLTPRELEVLVLVARGHTNRQVAGTLQIAEKTVRNHVEHIYTKIGRSTRAGAALYAMQHGLLLDLAPAPEGATR